MTTINLLYKSQYDINDHIHIMIPTVGQVIDQEDNYYGLVSALTAMPIDLMVQLDDIGIDFSQITDYDLFLRLFHDLKQEDTSLIFGDLDLSQFELAVNEENGNVVLVDAVHEIVIDRAIQGQIAETLRKIHHLEKNMKRPANKEALDFMLQRARVKMRRQRNRKSVSHLESLIIALVNTEQYKYNFAETLDLTIYQFNESVQQIIHKIDYNNRMYGVYTGNISAKDLSQDDLNWLIHK